MCACTNYDYSIYLNKHMIQISPRNSILRIYGWTQLSLKLPLINFELTNLTQYQE